MNVFALGLDAILANPSFGEDALWKAGGSGPGVPVRIVHRAPDQMERFGDSRALLGSTVIELRRVDAPTIAEGDTIEIGGNGFRVIAEPKADAVGLSIEVELTPS